MEKKFLKYSSYLISKNSFITGAGRLLDVSGSYNIYNSSATESEADSKATACDWFAVGDDIRYATEQFELKNYNFITDEQTQKEKEKIEV